MRPGGGTLGVRGVCSFLCNAPSGAIVSSDPVSILLVLLFEGASYKRVLASLKVGSSCLGEPA